MSGFIAQAARQARGRPSVRFSGRTNTAIPFVRAVQRWKEQNASLLKTLTPREEKIIKMCFGLEDGSEHTLEEAVIRSPSPFGPIVGPVGYELREKITKANGQPITFTFEGYPKQTQKPK